jgi:diguanylate cyclase (GGDEF)-like protein
VDVRVVLRDKTVAFAWVLVLLEAGLCVLLPRGFASTAVGDVIQSCLIFLALRSCSANLRTTEHRSRLFWAFLSLGLALWLTAQLLWTYFEVVLRQEVPNFFVGDIVLFLHLVPMMAALAVQPHAERDPTVPLGPLDFTLLLTWWLYLYVFLVIPWQFVSANETVYGRNFDGAYFAGHFVFLASAAAAWLHSSGSWRVTYRNLFGAGLVYAVGSMASGLAIDLGKYYTGSFYDLPLLAAMGWFVALGSIGRQGATATETLKPPREKREIWLSSAATITILSLPVMATWALYLSDAPMLVRHFRLLLTLATMIVMGTLAWIKQYRADKELARANRELREDSLTDLLTGARNRRFLAGTIEADIGHVLRAYARGLAPPIKRDRDLVFYLIDADSFKETNDQYGHAVGDKVLLEIARRISSAIRHSDVLIRWGGDEFLVVSRYTDRDEAAHLAKRVLSALASETFEIEGCLNLKCTCSIGWAPFPWFMREPKRVSYDDVLRLADCALYDAKKAGKNRAVGLLPAREEPDLSAGSVLLGKQARLTEQLSARSITVPGPPPIQAATSGPPADSRALAATQGI